MTDERRVCVAMPLYGASESAGIPKATVAALWYLSDHLGVIVGEDGWDHADIKLEPNIHTTSIEHARNDLVRRFLEHERSYTDLLFWDSDQTGTPRQLGKILGRMLRSELPIVSCPTVAKHLFYKQCARAVYEYLIEHGWERNPRRVPTEARLEEIIRGSIVRPVPDVGLYVDMIGGSYGLPLPDKPDFVPFTECNFAFALVRREVLETMWRHYGQGAEMGLHYTMKRASTADHEGWDEDHVGLFHTMIRDHRYFSEDTSFALRWKALGGKCYLYIGEGAPIGHVGHTTFEGTREGMLADWSKNYPRFQKP